MLTLKLAMIYIFLIIRNSLLLPPWGKVGLGVIKVKKKVGLGVIKVKKKVGIGVIKV